MVDLAGLYVVIADQQQARFVRPGPDGRLHTVRVVKDQPGQTQDDEFPDRLAQRISDDFSVDLFTHLVLVAPPDLLPHLTSMIDAPTGESVIGCLAMDLVAVPDRDLWPHLDQWVRPMCRV